MGGGFHHSSAQCPGEEDLLLRQTVHYWLAISPKPLDLHPHPLFANSSWLCADIIWSPLVLQDREILALAYKALNDQAPLQ